MATVTHSKVSGAGPASSPSLVGGDDWDAAHVLDLSTITGTNGGAAAAGGSIAISGGTGDSGNDAGAYIVVHGGSGDGVVGAIAATGAAFSFEAPTGGKIELSDTGTISLLPGVGDGYIQVNPDSTFSLGGDITLESGGVFVSIRAGTADPSAGGGLAANIASLYCRASGGTTGELWIKTGSADTAWTKVV